MAAVSAAAAMSCARNGGVVVPNALKANRTGKVRMQWTNNSKWAGSTNEGSDKANHDEPAWAAPKDAGGAVAGFENVTSACHKRSRPAWAAVPKHAT